MKLLSLFLLLSTLPPAGAADCAGKVEPHTGGLAQVWALDAGGIAAFAKMNVNLDGYAHAYHPANYAAGALLHLCNAGKVYLPDGSSYEGSESQATCTGRFMSDFKRIGDAGWTNPAVGAIHWYGIVGEQTATIHGKTITSVHPVLQQDDSGFYVSPTSLVDPSVKDLKNQDRYINPLRVPSAVVPGSLLAKGVRMGSFGVAIDRRKEIAVPFVVGDGGPRIGEGSAALARMVAGQPASNLLTRQTRGVGQVDGPDVLWVFFAGPPAAYDHTHPEHLAEGARAAFAAWGGEPRLLTCLATVPRN